MEVKKRAKIVVKYISFFLITCICVGIVNGVLKPKYYYNEMWPSTNTTRDFYKLKKNSVDVLILGSSHSMAAINPQVIYDNYGITSYNLGSEQQSVLVSYYWLKEALKYQDPKVVIIDTFTFHRFPANYVENGMNCSEESVRKAMDNMRISPLKWEAAKEIEKHDPTQSALSYFLLNIRYHSRWKNLGEGDYSERAMVDHGGVKGFTTLGGFNSLWEDFQPFCVTEAEASESEEWVDVAKEYVDKIVELCEKKGIQLIFVNIPYGEWPNRYKANIEYAEAKGIPYYDFNEEHLYNEIGYNAVENLLGHPNYLGAEKISSYLGNMLATEYNVAGRMDTSYDDSRETYNHKIENINLTMETDAYWYLHMLKNESYSLFVFAPTSYSAYLDEKIMSEFNDLGFATSLIGTPIGTHYIAIKDKDDVIECLTKEDMSFSNSIRNGAVTYKFEINTEEMWDRFHIYSMVVDGEECGGREPGISIVVYDNDFRYIVDKVNINTDSEELTVSHY